MDFFKKKCMLYSIYIYISQVKSPSRRVKWAHIFFEFFYFYPIFFCVNIHLKKHLYKLLTEERFKIILVVVFFFLVWIKWKVSTFPLKKHSVQNLCLANLVCYLWFPLYYSKSFTSPWEPLLKMNNGYTKASMVNDWFAYFRP